jgi:hypothetical protein
MDATCPVNMEKKLDASGMYGASMHTDAHSLPRGLGRDPTASVAGSAAPLVAGDEIGSPSSPHWALGPDLYAVWKQTAEEPALQVPCDVFGGHVSSI